MTGLGHGDYDDGAAAGRTGSLTQTAQLLAGSRRLRPMINGLPEAGNLKRAGADLLDLALAGFVLSILNHQNGGITPTPALIAFFIGFPLYYSVFDAFGGTVGKRLLGLRVVDLTSGRAIGLRRGLLRGFLTVGALLTRLFPLLIASRRASGRSPWLQDSLTNSTIVDRRALR